MVRVFLKGGVWKNSEDEILKAAIQKYGKQQWARVASLLNRKTAKQAKARWYEWLDPSIRKTEWSNVEEEKLLHLAKLLPAQWKTIAVTIGRTATQCQEHYEYLLDQAATTTTNADGIGSTSTDQLRAAAASSQLRVGQIDSNPESKPARPDPIDMDEDEMEMLQEARARLANTQGKKAKRKQRERTLLQAKRFADLQKRRELKQAGLLSKNATKKSKLSKKQIDLGVEIPFHKVAPIGFHDVSIENKDAETIRIQRLQKINVQQINEAQYRSRDKEAQSLRKKEENRMKMLQQSNDKYATAYKKEREQEQIQTSSYVHRKPLQLPAPTISNDEYIQVAKEQHIQNQQIRNAFIEGTGTGMNVTQTLLSDYTDHHHPSMDLPTHFRASTTTNSSVAMSKQQQLMKEANQLRQLERGQTPLIITPTTAITGGNEEDGEGVDLDQITTTTKKDKNSGSTGAATTVRTMDTRTSTVVVRDKLGLNNNRVEYLVDHQGGMGNMVKSIELLKRPPPSSTTTATTNNNNNDDLLLANDSNFPNYDDQNDNHADNASVGASTFASSKFTSVRELARQQRRAAKRARLELEKAFASLPEPQYEYELGPTTPTLLTEDENDEGKQYYNNNANDDMDMGMNHNESTPSLSLPKVDRADIEAAEIEKIRFDIEKKYESRNSVLKRTTELSRPIGHSIKALQSILVSDSAEQMKNDNGVESVALQLIRMEMQKLIQHDANVYPIPFHTESSSSSSKKKKMDSKKLKDKSSIDDTISTSKTILAVPPPVQLDSLDENQLLDAKTLIQKELEIILDEKVISVMTNTTTTTGSSSSIVLSNREDALEYLTNMNMKISKENGNQLVYVQPDGWMKNLKQENENDENDILLLRSMELEFDTIMDATNILKKKNDKSENKMKVIISGYQKRFDKLQNEIHTLYETIQDTNIECSTYRTLQQQEHIGGEQRIQSLQRMIQQCKELHKKQQKIYSELLLEKNKQQQQQQ